MGGNCVVRSASKQLEGFAIKVRFVRFWWNSTSPLVNEGVSKSAKIGRNQNCRGHLPKPLPTRIENSSQNVFVFQYSGGLARLLWPRLLAPVGIGTTCRSACHWSIGRLGQSAPAPTGETAAQPLSREGGGGAARTSPTAPDGVGLCAKTNGITFVTYI